MKNVGFLIVLLLFFNACKKDNQLEKEISKIDVDVTIERFDLSFADAKPSDLPKLKSAYPFLFSERINDSVWIDRMNDTLQQELSSEVRKTFSNFEAVKHDIQRLFQHLKYYDKTFQVPRIIT